MTVLEALKSAVNFPFDDLTYERILIDRGLNKDDAYSASMSGTIELCRADAIKVILTTPNISESGFSLTVSEKKELKAIADAIYKKHGEATQFNPKVSSIKPW